MPRRASTANQAAHTELSRVIAETRRLWIGTGRVRSHSLAKVDVSSSCMPDSPPVGPSLLADRKFKGPLTILGYS